VRVIPTNGSITPPAVGLFGFKSGAVTLTETGVGDSIGRSFQIYVEGAAGSATSGSIQTGIALANVLNTPGNVNLELLRLDGTPTDLRLP
jgi:hypothetical protein